MANGEWLSNLRDFLLYYNVTPNVLLFFTAVFIIAFIFSLREFTSWLTKTSGFKRDIQLIKESQKMIEQKLDHLLTRELTKESITKTEDQPLNLDFPVEKPVQPTKKKPSFGISH